MTLEYKGTSIFYTDDGNGEPIVLLHGFLENTAMWKPFLPELSKKNRVICIDLLGHGKTGCLGYIHTMELMAETIGAVLNHLNIENPTLVGHSMGGYVSLAFAERNQDTLKGLCLLNSTPQEDSQEKKQNRDRAIIAVKQNHKTFIRMAVANLFSTENRTNFKTEINETIEHALKTPLQGIIAALEGMKIRKNRLKFLQNLSTKKMIIIGQKDPVLSYENLISIIEPTNIKIIKLPDGHMSHIENKDEILHEIMYFIEK